MTPTRIVALLAAALLVGCSKPPRPQGAAADQPAAAPTPTGDPKADAEAFAKLFLKAVNDGTATPAMLTPEFKKVIAEPVFPSDEPQGYSDDAAEQWLLRFKGAVPNPLTGAAGTGDAVVITGAAGAPPRHLALRAVRAGGGWRADWFYPAPVGSAASSVPGGGAAFPAFAAAAFLDALLAKDDRLAEGLLTQRYKAALAPPLPSDKRGYNRGLLGGKLAGFRGDVTGYRVTRVEGETVAGELTKGDAKKPFTLKLVKGDRPWDWLVDEFKAE